MCLLYSHNHTYPDFSIFSTSRTTFHSKMHLSAKHFICFPLFSQQPNFSRLYAAIRASFTLSLVPCSLQIRLFSSLIHHSTIHHFISLNFRLATFIHSTVNNCFFKYCPVFAQYINSFRTPTFSCSPRSF